MRLIKKYAVLMVCIVQCSLLNANIDRIAGTNTCFEQPADAERFSPIHGAIAWETGTIMRIYDYAPLFDVEEAKAHFLAEQKPPAASAEPPVAAVEEKPAIPVPVAEVKQPEMPLQDLQEFLSDQLRNHLRKSSAVVQLVYEIFHRQSMDSVSVADFVVTANITKNLDPQVVAILVGHILVVIKRLEQINNLAVEKKEPKTAQDILATYQKELFQQQPATQRKQQSPSPTVDKLIRKIGDKLAGDFKLDAILTLGVDKKAILDEWSQLIKGMFAFSIKAFIFSNPFPPETVRLILLALLYQTSHLDPQILAIYYDTLGRIGNVAIKPQQGVAAKFSPADIVAYAACVKKTNSPEKFKENYEEIVYTLLFPQFKIVPYDQARLLKQDGVPTGYTFADCMDNASRNLFNFLTYDQSSNSLKLDVLQRKLKDILKEKFTNFNDRLARFYAQPIAITDIANQRLHDLWTMVISNIPYVTYAKVAYVNKPEPEKYDWPGFIKISENDASNKDLAHFLGEHQYRLISYTQGHEEDAIAYEMQPSLRNIIIVLDTLLKLGIFSDQNPIVREFARPDFVVVYLPQVFDKIGLKIESGIDVSIDADDLTGKQKKITTHSFTIATSRGHGEFDILRQQETRVSFPRIGINNLIIPFSAILLPRNADSIKMLIDQQKYYLALFSLPLDNPDFVSSSVDHLKLSESILELFLAVAKRHADPHVRMQSICKLYVRYMQLPSEPSISILQDSVDAAKNAFQSDKHVDREQGINLFKVLFAKGKGTESAQSAANRALEAEDVTIYKDGLILFRELVRNGDAIGAAVEAAKKSVTSRVSDVQITGLKLFEELMSKDIECDDESLAAAQTAISSQNDIVLEKGLELFQKLVKKNRKFDKAAGAAAQKAILSNDSTVQAAGCALFEKLFDQGQSFDAAIAIAQQALETSDSGEQEAGIKLFEKLFTHNKGFEEAITAAQKVMASPNLAYDAGVDLFTKLFDYGRGFDEAKEVASNAAKKSDRFIRSAGIALLKALEKNPEYQRQEKFKLEHRKLELKPTPSPRQQ